MHFEGFKNMCLLRCLFNEYIIDQKLRNTQENIFEESHFIFLYLLGCDPQLKLEMNILLF